MQQTSPLIKLRNKKEWIRLESNEKEEKLKEHFSYIKENAGNLALSGISSLIFGSKNDQKANDGKHAVAKTKTKEFSPLNLISSLTAGKGIFNIALEIAQPFLITWGFGAVKKLLKKTFTKKRK